MLSFLLQRVNIIAWKLHFALQAVSKAPGCAHHQFAPIKLSGFSSYFITPPSAKEIFPFAWVASLEKSAQTVQKEALTLNLRTFSICWCARGQWSAPRTIILASAAELSLTYYQHGGVRGARVLGHVCVIKYGRSYGCQSPPPPRARRDKWFSEHLNGVQFPRSPPPTATQGHRHEGCLWSERKIKHTHFCNVVKILQTLKKLVSVWWKRN